MSEQDRFYAKCRKNADSGCLEWQAYRNTGGYGTFYKDGGIFILAHRWAYERVFGPVPEGQFVLHRCDNPRCVNPDHLWLGTKLDNARDRDQKGRRIALRGEQHGRSKLLAEQIIEIRGLGAGGMTSYRIAKLYRVDSKTVRDILTRKLWPHITGAAA